MDDIFVIIIFIKEGTNQMALRRQKTNRKAVRLSLLIMAAAFLLILQCTDTYKAQAANLSSYTVKTDSVPINSKYTRYSTYTSDTKQYYMLRSYLEQLEKDGGGTLTLSAGTYKISNTLYIPSNTTIILEDGVVVKKIAETGSVNMKSSKSIFQLVTPTKASIKGVYGGYNGETNINLLGNGNAILDLNYVTDSLGIMMAHNTNVKISGITFQNMKGGHFIELDASSNVTIENNSFRNHKPSLTGTKEAINIDTPDLSTGGFHATWTNYDCTPDKDVLIRNNSFNDLERAVGTHKYSENKYHENIQLLNNQIERTDSDAIRILNWSNPIIKGNDIKNVAGGEDNKRGVLASGVSNPVITNNTFNRVSRPIQIMPWKNTGPGSTYAITYNNVSGENIALMLSNTLVDVKEKFIRINKSYNVFTYNTDKYYFYREDD